MSRPLCLGRPGYPHRSTSTYSRYRGFGAAFNNEAPAFSGLAVRSRHSIRGGKPTSGWFAAAGGVGVAKFGGPLVVAVGEAAVGPSRPVFDPVVVAA